MRTEAEIRERLNSNIEQYRQLDKELDKAIQSWDKKLIDNLSDKMGSLSTMTGTLLWVLDTTEEEDNELTKGLYD